MRASAGIAPRQPGSRCRARARGTATRAQAVKLPSQAGQPRLARKRRRLLLRMCLSLAGAAPERTASSEA